MILVKDKFERRIKRLYRAFDSKKLIYFVRTEITKEETQEFVNLLKTRFDSLNYLLIAIGGTEEFKEKWNMPTVRNFYLPNYDKTFFDPEGWKFIFEELGLIDNEFSNSHTLTSLVNELLPNG